MSFNVRAAYMNGLRFAIGRCSVQNYMRTALSLLASGRLNAAPLAGTELPRDAVASYPELASCRKKLAKDRKHRNFLRGHGFDGQACLFPGPKTALYDRDANPVFLEFPSHPHAGRFTNTRAIHKRQLAGWNFCV